MKRRLLLLSLPLVLLGSILACQPTTTLSTNNTEIGTGGSSASGGVAPRFREFYENHGGKPLLGIAISPLFTNNGVEYQYTAKVLMAYNPAAERSRQFYFAPIGVELGVAEPPSDPGAPGGHKIHQGFIGTYERLGGTRLAGVPLTDVRYNQERGGVDQYFENLGMYQLESDPNTVYLINYGAWMCASVCNFNSDPVGNVMASVVNQPFVATTRLDPTFTGKPLTDQYVASDGRVEQIFENMVVVEASDRPGGIALRPITAMLGVSGQPSVQIDVPGPILEMINQNTGFELSGLPVTQYTRQSDEVYRQCFVSLCMDYFPNKPEDLQVSPTPLGYLYKNRYFRGGISPTPVVGQEITLSVILGYSLVDPDQAQIITVYVYNNDQPYADIRPTLNLMLPGRKAQSITFPPTGSNGRTSVQLDPISAAHGTRVDIQVCAVNGACLDDYFLVWGDP